jgi:hypothetical protein
MNHELYIVNYCHPDCPPLSSITRLPEAEAYAMAEALSSKHKGTSIGRFTDFINYYPRRIRTEKWLYDRFVELGGEPATEHPLYFVLHGSDYLNEWFDKGKAIKLPLAGIDSKHISFTFGDSMTKMDKPERKDPFTKETLYKIIESYDGSVDGFFNDIAKQWRYIEAQLWNDAYCRGCR